MTRDAPTLVSDDVTRIAHALGRAPRTVKRIASGHTGPVLLVDDEIVVKLESQDAHRVEIEGRMLRYLAKSTAAPVPRVIAMMPGLLAMDHVEHDGSAAGAHLAEVLSSLHDVTSERFGFDEDTPIGGLMQPNSWSRSWCAFFATQRLLAFVPDEPSIASRLRALADKIEDVIDEPDRPRLGHGDLWSGNVLTRNHRVAALIDPALAYVDAEADLSLLELFGVDDTFFPAYFERRPPRPGRRERALVYRLWPLLVHAKLFGRSYLPDIDRTLRALGF